MNCVLILILKRYFFSPKQNLGSSRRNSLNENNIKLLPGESIAASAKNVLMFSPVGDFKKGISGVLVVTNFKLTFLTTEHANGEVIII